MIKRLLFVLTAVLLMAMPVFGYDLGSYPAMFTRKSTRIVIGKGASTEDVLGAVDIAVSLQQRMGEDKRLERAVLDTEVDNLEDMNTIVVGGPCINSMAAKLMGYPKNCLEGFELGKGIIKLYRFKDGNYALLAAGTLALDTRRVTSVLANYQDYALDGNEMIVTGLSISDLEINPK
ncbi:hypothetical protein GF361_00730 [Candidatus Woesearchaeota archaeon]|nr:hypothetical protein [Candidatus Woesearchaeota archaeon]